MAGLTPEPGPTPRPHHTPLPGAWLHPNFLNRPALPASCLCPCSPPCPLDKACTSLKPNSSISMESLPHPHRESAPLPRLPAACVSLASREQVTVPHDLAFFVSPRPSPACKPLREGCVSFTTRCSASGSDWQSGVLGGSWEEQEVPVVPGSGRWPGCVT